MLNLFFLRPGRTVHCIYGVSSPPSKPWSKYLPKIWPKSWPKIWSQTCPPLKKKVFHALISETENFKVRSNALVDCFCCFDGSPSVRKALQKIMIKSKALLKGVGGIVDRTCTFLFVVCRLSLGRVVLYTEFMVFPLPETLIKNLTKHLVKNLTKNLI